MTVGNKKRWPRRRAIPSFEQFKTEIDLRVYAASKGYAWDKRQSWRGSAVMRHPSGDKIIIKRDADGHFVYFSVRDEADHGSIIDFLQRRENYSFGAIRQQLRPVDRERRTRPGLLPGCGNFNTALPCPGGYRQKPDSGGSGISTDAGCPAAPLHGKRAAHTGFVVEFAARFAGRVRIDGYGNAVFPHFDAEGLCGYEIKNKGFTGFAKGGRKGLCFSHAEIGDDRLVI